MLALNQQLNQVETAFKQGLNQRNLGSWFDLGEKALAHCEEINQSLAKPAAQLTAWIAVRGDTPAQQEKSLTRQFSDHLK